MALNTMLNTNTNVPSWAGDALGVGATTQPVWATDSGWPQSNRLREGSKKSPSQTLKEAYASTRLGEIYKAPSTTLAPIVSAPPSPAPAPVATPASWLPPVGASGAGGGSMPMGGSTVTTGGGGGGIDAGSMLSGLGSLASGGPGSLASGGSDILEQISDWFSPKFGLGSSTMNAGGATFAEAAGALGMTPSALAAMGPEGMALAQGVGIPGTAGNAASVFGAGGGSLGSGAAYPTDTLAGDYGQNTTFGGSGGDDILGGVGDYFSPSAGSQTLADYAASQGLASTAAAPWIGAPLPASSNTIGTMLAGWGGLSAPGTASLVAAGMPSLPAGMLAGLASPAAWAALPITLGIQSLLTRGDTKEEEAAKAKWIARVEKNLSDIRHGRIDSASGLANITMGRRNESNRHLLERTAAGSHDVSPLGADKLRANQAWGGLKDVALLDSYQAEGHFDDPSQIAELDRWRKKLLADAGIADRAEYDKLFADWKKLQQQGATQGGEGADYWRQQTATAYLNNPETRRLIDLFGGNEFRDNLGLERMNIMNNPGDGGGPPPSIPITQVPLDYRDNEFINPNYQPPRPDLMEGIEQLPDGRYWRSEGPGDIPSSGNMVPASEFASLQQQMAAPVPTTDHRSAGLERLLAERKVAPAGQPANLEGLKQLPGGGGWWRPEGPNDIPSSGNTIDPASYGGGAPSEIWRGLPPPTTALSDLSGASGPLTNAQIQSKVSAGANPAGLMGWATDGSFGTPPDPSASMLNLQSFTDIPGMAGRSSGDLIGINPGFTDPAVQQAYTGFTGNVPGAGRTLLDLFNANPTAYSRFQQALA